MCEIENPLPKYNRPAKQESDKLKAASAQQIKSETGWLMRSIKTPYIKWLLATALTKLGVQDLEGAEIATRKVLEVAENLHGPLHPETLQVVTLLGQITYMIGDLDEHANALEKAYEIIKGMYPTGNHIRVAAAATDLAEAYWDQGREKDAENLLVRALGTAEGLLQGLSKNGDPEEWLKVNEMMHMIKSDLALAYDSQRRFGEAEPLHVDVFRELPWGSGYNHPQYFTLLNSKTWASPVETPEGVQLSEEDIKAKLQKDMAWRLTVNNISNRMGKEHRGLIRPLNRLAQLYITYRQFEPATETLKRLMSIQRRLRGADSTAACDVLSLMATLSVVGDNPEQAARLCDQAKFLRAQQQGYGHLHVSYHVYEHGLAKLAQGYLDEGQSLIMNAHRVMDSYIPVGEDHPWNSFLHRRRLQLKQSIQDWQTRDYVEKKYKQTGLKVAPGSQLTPAEVMLKTVPQVLQFERPKKEELNRPVREQVKFEDEDLVPIPPERKVKIVEGVQRK